MGEGGSIPFMAMLGERFPAAQFVVTGVLGPHSNAHGPNEFLHIPTGKQITQVIAQVLADHHARERVERLRRRPWPGGRPNAASPARRGGLITRPSQPFGVNPTAFSTIATMRSTWCAR